ncbi:LysR family transcriptional regulator [Pseudomonas aeruginosa]|jgi:DNA-binding transcriptional LysR family regulator|uniref:LysR family transcriptional regulator n=1 Tax=Pseudomonas aeruginosa TaxID=287 RepID=UPI001495B71D|nr:LysR family transcriptional regulator [Pseudomonas aeruginosa]MBH9516743.1 LysR family transcriptional regulator [Pseudomonas aeruginosa]MCU9211694.1 LysR family transcriptional regulator [Pseudomonas aeruginosa]HCE6123144.1 LysR family transcriptional regulator [Pseudomonas aeruginosa]
MRNFDLNLLRALRALLEKQDVQAAAMHIGVPLTAMDAMLTRLREAFCDPLLVQSADGTVATERAREIAEGLERIFDELEILLVPSR